MRMIFIFQRIGENVGKEDKKELSTIQQDSAALSFLEQTGLSLPEPFTRDILLMHTMINGAMHVDHIHELARQLQAGDQVKLVLEPHNPVDPRAIQVRNQENKKLGYIPRKKNEVLFHLMDAGKYLYGVVTDGDIGEELDENNTWVEIFIDVYMRD